MSIWRRRRYSAEFKVKAVQKCTQSGVPIVVIVLHHRLNVNLLRRWIAEQEAKNGVPEDRELMRVSRGEFIPLWISESTAAALGIRIEVHRGATMISLHRPRPAAAQRARWLQGWLR